MTADIGFVFPGQGSQKIEMLADLAKKFAIVKDTFKQASQVLGFDLWALSQDGPEEDLNKTENTQPALLAASVSIWRVWQQEKGIIPKLFAGHSLGEYSALVCADVIAFEDAVNLVHQRGKFMQQASPSGVGSMAAIIGLSEDVIIDICHQVTDSGVVTPANFNSIGQTVIAGDKKAVQLACMLAEKRGARKVLTLAVSVPSHCDLMKPAARELTQLLTEIAINPAKIPIINNVNAQIETEPDKIRIALIEQLTMPVRWVETIQEMATQGIQLVVECGPGRVLTGLNKRIDKSLSYLSINSPENIETALSQVST